MRQILNVHGPLYISAAFTYMEPLYYVLLRRLRLFERRDYDTAGFFFSPCVRIYKGGGGLYIYVGLCICGVERKWFVPPFSGYANLYAGDW